MRKYRFVKRVLLTCTLMLLIPVAALLTLQMVFVSRSARQQMIDQARMTASQYVSYADAKLHTAVSLTRQLVVDDDLRTVISDSDAFDMDGDTYLALQSLMVRYGNLTGITGIKAHSLCMTNTRSIIHQMYDPRYERIPDKLDDYPWFNEALEGHGKLMWQGVSMANGVPVISVSCAVRDVKAKHIVGTILMTFQANDVFYSGVDDDEVSAVIYYNEETGEIFGNTPYLEEMQKAAQPLLTGERAHVSAVLDDEMHIMVKSATGAYGWCAICAHSGGKIFSAINFMSLIMTVILAAIFGFMTAYVLRIYTKLLKPLEKAMEFINMNTGHMVYLKSDASGYPELQTLQQQVVSMVRGKHIMEQKLVEVNQQKNMSQLKELQMQINPHFLYNTLNSIKILADTGRNRDVSNLIVNLVYLLNSAMDRSGLFVPVEKEVETLRRYMNIQNVIYENTISMEIDVDDDVENITVPNFILQPIVENALQHGMDRSKDHCFVRVTGMLEEEELVFTIEDNGVGISDEKLKQIYQDMQAEVTDGHLGIRSVHRRIQLSCGEKYGITIQSKPGEGTVFIIRLPQRGIDQEMGGRYV